MGRQDQGGGRHAVSRKMVLRQPGPVKPQFLSVLHLFRRLAMICGKSVPSGQGTWVKKANFISSYSCRGYSVCIVLTEHRPVVLHICIWGDADALQPIRATPVSIGM